MPTLVSPVRSASLLLLLLTGSACASVAQDESPRLMVMVVVDQLPTALLDRYDEHFTSGLRRLRDDGFRFTNGTHEHSVTETAAGHATIATGMFPRKHGIVSNNWYEFPDGEVRNVYAVEDTLSRIVGLPMQPGRSPSNLNRGGMADWVLAADSGALVVSVSKKDRAAITMAGQAPGHVYWLDANDGRYVTSVWYRERYPGWVERFNREARVQFFADSVWTSTIPPGLEAAAPRADSVVYEGDRVHTTFPHQFVLESIGASPVDFNLWISETPVVDQATVALATTAARELEIGQDDIVDYLSVSLSQTDYVGHAYGPLSVEQLDNLLRMDRVLGEFLSFLDEYVGSGRWVLGMSSDHGVLAVPEYLQETGQTARRIGRDELTTAVNAGQLAMRLGASQGPEVAAERAAEALEDLDFIADVMPEAELAGPPSDDAFVRLQQNSYFPGRHPGLLNRYGVPVEVRYTKGTLLYPGGAGTTHGSAYEYDRQVPIVFLGAGVSAGTSEARARTVDVAPTLAGLAGIPVPLDLDGRSILP